MKTKIILFSLSLFFFTGLSHAQKGKGPQSFISNKVRIEKYQNKSDLENMQKGELIKLYAERVNVLIHYLPNVAFATKPGVTMATLGIPINNTSTKDLDENFEAIDDFMLAVKKFHNAYLPYSDTGNLIAGILFYEEIMKSLYSYDDFR